MKHYLLLAVLLCTPFLTNSQNTKNDKLPEKLYGEWYQKVGQREYNGILIRPDFIEYFYQACRYGKIEDRDSLYSIASVLNNGDTATFSIQFIADDTIKVVRPGGDIAVYGKVDCPPNGTRINPDDLPKNLRKTWYSTDGKNSLEFDLTNNKFLFNDVEYTSEDVIFYNERWGAQYRIIAKNSVGKVMMFYFKNGNDSYVQVGYNSRNGDYYKVNPQYPNVSCADPEDFIKEFAGSWYTTNGKNRVGYSYQDGEISLQGKKYKIERLEKSGDSYRLFLSSGKLLKPYMLRKETDDYILLGKYKSKPELLKRTRTDKNYLTYKLPESLKGQWYSTDDRNDEAVSISSDEVILWGKKIKNPVFGKTPNGIGILTKSEKFIALITVVTHTHIEVKTKKGKTAILKRTPEAENTMYLSVNDLPENLKGNWFGTDGSEYWAFGITDNFFVAANAFWNYLDIAYKSNTYTINVENDNGVNNYVFKPLDTETCEISRNSGQFKTYTSDISKAVYKPQNKYGSRKTKDVFIQGFVTNLDKELPRTINFMVNNIVFDEQVTYPAKIDKDGRFSVTIPKIYGQDIFLKHEDFRAMFVSPGDSLLICLNSGNSDSDFMGDDADACYDIVKSIKFLNSSIKHSNWKEQKEHLANDTCFVYKEYLKDVNETDKVEVAKFISKNDLSKNVISWLNNSIKYDYPKELMRYRWLHSRTNRFSNIPDSYFGFIKEYPINLNSDLISSNFQGYCHELYMYYFMKAQRDTTLKYKINGETILNYLEEHNVKVPDEIKNINSMILKDEKISKDQSKIVSEFYDAHSSLVMELYYKYQLSMQKEYFEKIDFPEVYQLTICTRLFGVINNSDTTELKKQVPLYMAEITNPDYRLLLQQKFDKQLEMARVPFVIEDAMLTQDNPTSGDSLLVNIVNKHKGKVIYVDFWATWCGPCRGEMPFSLKIQEKMKGKDVVFVYLCSDSSPKTKWKQLINQFKITGDHYYVNKAAWSDLTGRFGITGIPHYVVIDKNGKVVQRAAKRPSQGDALVKDLEELLK